MSALSSANLSLGHIHEHYLATGHTVGVLFIWLRFHEWSLLSNFEIDAVFFDLPLSCSRPRDHGALCACFLH